MLGEEGSWSTSRVKESGEFSETEDEGRGGCDCMLCSPKAPFQGDSTIILSLAAT